MEVDYLIVGSGLTGAVIARSLKDAGRQVLIVDRRSHCGGNVFDHHHPSGIRIHTYGPHYFRTSSDKIWAFVRRFGGFYRYEPVLQSLVDGIPRIWPVTKEYIQETMGLAWEPSFKGVPANFEEASLAMMPRYIYEKFVKGYTEKQWGVAAESLTARLAGRFRVNSQSDPRLSQQRYQGIPEEGYAEFMKNLVAGVPLLLNCDYLKERSVICARRLAVFTGPIDEYFDFRLGRLMYRGQRREHRYLPEADLLQPCGQLNNPDPTGGAHIRTLEWKQMLPREYAERIRGTVLTTETPITPSDPDQYEYPFPDDHNQALYQEYRKMAMAAPGLLVCGRLGEYRYYDMDHSIDRALCLAERIIAAGNVAESISALYEGQNSGSSESNLPGKSMPELRQA